MWIPIELATKGLQSDDHARPGVLLAEDGGEGAADGLVGAAGEDAEESTLTEKELTERNRNGEDPMSMVHRGQDLLAELLGQEQGPLLLAG